MQALLVKKKQKKVKKMSDTVVVACKIRNGLNIGHAIRGFYHPPGEPTPENTFYGYAFTEGVPRKLWDSWLALNGEAEVVTGGHIMAADSAEELKTKLVQRIGFRKRTFGSVPYTGRR